MEVMRDEEFFRSESNHRKYKTQVFKGKEETRGTVNEQKRIQVLIMPPKYTVHKKDLDKGAKIEQREHPWASQSRARRIARDHLQQNGPAAYRAEPVIKRVVQNVNKEMHARPIRRKKAPRPFNPLTDSPW